MNLHQKHTLLSIEDEENLKKENLTIEKSSKEFDEDIQKLSELKELTKKEIEKIDANYEKVHKETTKFFEIKRAELNEKEENLKEKLKTEVTKIKESLDDYLTQIEYLSKSCERIKKGVQALEKEEKYMIKNLSYISKINKNKNEIYTLLNSLMKNLEINFNEKEENIVYNEYCFNGIKKEKNYDKYELKKVEKIKESEKKPIFNEEKKMVLSIKKKESNLKHAIYIEKKVEEVKKSNKAFISGRKKS